ncbi:hypothetical protein BG015_002059 [Linnemannia schmuckeri]|uniref:dolichyl-phosphate-mannose--protein mannosyltransferase n=1 Tax=Linnemannia schmuckeri TaxID=64567 RepID=A0A9P5RQV6_9FUNG|nr:hypothetical protein BG015_002059 [Linnemannia schmuckeri]
MTLLSHGSGEIWGYAGLETTFYYWCIDIDFPPYLGFIVSVTPATTRWIGGSAGPMQLDETNMGQLVNGYAKGEFVLDAHPPLDKMILAGVGSLLNYNGSFEFEDIGVLCAPMAYTTLKASGHGAPATILATTLVDFGMSMAEAMSVKLVGIVSAMTTLYLMSLDVWNLAREKSVSAGAWIKHCVAPESDVDQLSRLYRHSLISHYPTEDHVQTWRDVIYGSVVQIQSEAKAHAGSVGNVYLHSSAEINPGRTRQQVVGGYSYLDINMHWIIIKAGIDSADEPKEIPSRLELVKNDDLLNEVSGYDGHGFDGDSNDWWVVVIVDAEALREGTKTESESIKALETTFRLKHYEIGCFLFASASSLPEPWGEGRSEIICRNDARVTGKSIWRIANNCHDYRNSPLQICFFSLCRLYGSGYEFFLTSPTSPIAGKNSVSGDAKDKLSKTILLGKIEGNSQADVVIPKVL